MRRFLTFILISACFATSFLACYAPVLFGDRQFGYRDSAHYYDPLHRRVQQEWEAGRWPLWEPEENAGMPLLGNPTAAVLYPGKLVFAILPYAWAARVYVVIHTALAFAAMLVLMRSWRTSWVGSALGALSYAFGAPIVFQYSNVVYLVGAAWLALGFHAADRWIRLGRRGGLVELAIVLAMQTLGGDPQSAYLLGWAAAGYAAGLAWGRARAARGAALQEAGERVGSGLGRRGGVAVAMIVLLIWIAGTLMLARWLPRLRPSGYPPPPLPWMAWMPRVVMAAWGLASLVFLASWRRRGWRSSLRVAWLGLALSAGLAMAIAAAQLLPALEFIQQTARGVGAGPHDLYPFSIEPFRMAELALPNVLGIEFGGNTHWRDALRLPGARPGIWAPSLYLGGLTLVLACGSLAIRRGPPWRIWLSVVAAVGLVGSLGQYTSPIWTARALAEVSGWPPLRGLVRDLGPLDPLNTPPMRLDGALRDGDGSLYWWLTMVLPGFRLFRFPAKLFTFTALGMAALAGLGWDGLHAGRARRFAVLFSLVLMASLAGLAGVFMARPAILEVFRRPVIPSMFGPLDAEGAFRTLAGSMARAAIVAGLGLAAVRLGVTRPRAAGVVALAVMTADLALADVPLIVTVPQAAFESTPEALQIIAEQERQDPAPGPFRIDRMPAWHPSSWTTTPAADRATDMVRWERDTLQAKYGIASGVEYTHTFGAGQLYDYDWFFDGFSRAVHTPAMADRLGVPLGKEVIYFPRRSYDLWNTRYFIIPSYPHGWRDPWRGYASFLHGSKPVYPPPGDAGAIQRSRQQDWQIRRNLDALPRAWVVHDARWLESSDGGTSMEARNRAMLEMLYADDPIWHDSKMLAFDPRTVAWIEDDLKPELEPFLSGRPPRPAETVRVSYPTPQRADLEVSLESPGLVILSDLYYPGWELTIDGRPAPIYRVNRLMRGAAVPTGRHRLIYFYKPRSFRVGLVLSLFGLGSLAVLALASFVRPVHSPEGTAS
jgi:hypothetical protein